MTTLIDSLSWWPWSAESGSIRNVRHAQQAPGMITLAWATRDSCPTLLTRRDGTEVFRDDVLRQEHRVTLTGWTGLGEEIVIRAGDVERAVQVQF